jgi:hypothetical protein
VNDENNFPGLGFKSRLTGQKNSEGKERGMDQEWIRCIEGIL